MSGQVPRDSEVETRSCELVVAAAGRLALETRRVL